LRHFSGLGRGLLGFAFEPDLLAGFKKSLDLI
jgi:hypothetical protein